ncbi:MAG TPA: hypothetical protein VG845_03165 [Dehalococcoidia bacterium]|nr:hypothetical protein [Dehalococcoidia bacterium]
MQDSSRPWRLGLWIPALTVFATAETAAVVNRLSGEESWDDLVWLFLIGTLGFSVLGCLILTQYRSHAVGWLLYAVGFLFQLSFLATEYGVYTLMTNPGALPFGPEVAIISWTGGTAFFVLTSLLFLIFPDGKLLTPRWRIALVLAGIAIFTASFGEFFKPGPYPDPLEAWDNPIGIPGAGNLMDGLAAIGLALTAVCGLAGVVSLVLRWKRAGGIEREQLKWVASSGVLMVSLWLLGNAGQVAGFFDESVQRLTVLLSVPAIPFAAGIAVLRYRLYDIDWIINRALVYVPLTAILAGVYIALTGAFRAVLASGSSTDFTVAMVTVIVVAMLTPVKNSLQEIVDKRFKEGQDPASQLQKLTAQTRTAVQVLDSDQLLRDYVEKSAQILDARCAILRLDNGTQGEVVVCGDSSGETVVSLSVSHNGKVFGTLMLGEHRSGRPYNNRETQALRESTNLIAYLLRLSPPNRRGSPSHR